VEEAVAVVGTEARAVGHTEAERRAACRLAAEARAALAQAPAVAAAAAAVAAAQAAAAAEQAAAAAVAVQAAAATAADVHGVGVHHAFLLAGLGAQAINQEFEESAEWATEAGLLPPPLPSPPPAAGGGGSGAAAERPVGGSCKSCPSWPYRDCECVGGRCFPGWGVVGRVDNRRRQAIRRNCKEQGTEVPAECQKRGAGSPLKRGRREEVQRKLEGRVQVLERRDKKQKAELSKWRSASAAGQGGGVKGKGKKGRGKAAGHPHGNLTWARAGARGAVRPHGNLTWTRAESEARGAGSGSGSGSGSSGGGGGRGAQ